MLSTYTLAFLKLNLTAGKTYSIQTTGLDALASMSIVPASNAVDFQVTVDPVSLPVQIGMLTFTADATGAYELSVCDASGFVGDYTVDAGVVTNSYTLVDGVVLPPGGREPPPASASGGGTAQAFFVHAMAGLGADGAGQGVGFAHMAGSPGAIGAVLAANERAVAAHGTRLAQIFMA